jgi:ribosomal protein L37AE/L43A
MPRTYDEWKTTDRALEQIETPEQPPPKRRRVCDVCDRAADDLFRSCAFGIETWYCEECSALWDDDSDRYEYETEEDR